MNCLWGDPTEEKELPLIDAAAEAGCEYFVIDAGWYLRLPAIATGASAGVIPSQLAIWSYPRQGAEADQASFNMVTAMLLRIHQSGHLARLDAPATAQVKEGIRVYKDTFRMRYLFIHLACPMSQTR
jgi:hypothetical protein